MKAALTKIIDFFRIDPTHGWATIDLGLTTEDLMADLDPGWSEWTALTDRPTSSLAA